MTSESKLPTTLYENIDLRNNGEDEEDEDDDEFDSGGAYCVPEIESAASLKSKVTSENYAGDAYSQPDSSDEEDDTLVTKPVESEKPVKKEKSNWKKDEDEKKNWNEEYQSLLEAKESKEKYQKIEELIHSFVQAAEMYGKVIISEVSFKEEQKTIKPYRLGGVAGGEKFLCNGIVFKFAVDHELKPGYFLYGGKERNDTLAQKSAKHELHNMIAFNEAQEAVGHKITKRICTPLMVLIDFNGYRLIAMSILPLKQLVYGSKDGGMTVLNSDPYVSNAMKLILGEGLNLKEHRVNEAYLYGPGDFECHIGSDGRYYALDYARLIPPEAPLPPRSSQSIYYFMLRKEFLRSKLSAPLNPDSFSGFGRSDPSFKTDNDLIISITKQHSEKTIPDFVSHLLLTPVEKLPPNLSPSSYLRSEIHKRAINLRHFGFIFSFLQKQLIILQHDDAKSKIGSIWTAIILDEMFSRSVSQHLRESMRQRVASSSSSPQFRCSTSISQFVTSLNEILAGDTQIWRSILQILQEKFANPLTDEQIERIVRGTWYTLNLHNVIQRISELLSVQFSDRCISVVERFVAENGKNPSLREIPLRYLQSAPVVLQLVSSDITEMRVKVWRSDQMNRSIAIRMLYEVAEILGYISKEDNNSSSHSSNNNGSRSDVSGFDQSEGGFKLFARNRSTEMRTQNEYQKVMPLLEHTLLILESCLCDSHTSPQLYYLLCITYYHSCISLHQNNIIYAASFADYQTARNSLNHEDIFKYASLGKHAALSGRLFLSSKNNNNNDKQIINDENNDDGENDGGEDGGFDDLCLRFGVFEALFEMYITGIFHNPSMMTYARWSSSYDSELLRRMFDLTSPFIKQQHNISLSLSPPHHSTLPLTPIMFPCILHAAEDALHFLTIDFAESAVLQCCLLLRLCSAHLHSQRNVSSSPLLQSSLSSCWKHQFDRVAFAFGSLTLLLVTKSKNSQLHDRIITNELPIFDDFFFPSPSVSRGETFDDEVCRRVFLSFDQITDDVVWQQLDALIVSSFSNRPQSLSSIHLLAAAMTSLESRFGVLIISHLPLLRHLNPHFIKANRITDRCIQFLAQRNILEAINNDVTLSYASFLSVLESSSLKSFTSSSAVWYSFDDVIPLLRIRLQTSLTHISVPNINDDFVSQLFSSSEDASSSSSSSSLPPPFVLESLTFPENPYLSSSSIEAIIRASPSLRKLRFSSLSSMNVAEFFSALHSPSSSPSSSQLEELAICGISASDDSFSLLPPHFWESYFPSLRSIDLSNCQWEEHVFKNLFASEMKSIRRVKLAMCGRGISDLAIASFCWSNLEEIEIVQANFVTPDVWMTMFSVCGGSLRRVTVDSVKGVNDDVLKLLFSFPLTHLSIDRSASINGECFRINNDDNDDKKRFRIWDSLIEINMTGFNFNDEITMFLTKFEQLKVMRIENNQINLIQLLTIIDHLQSLESVALPMNTPSLVIYRLHSMHHLRDIKFSNSALRGSDVYNSFKDLPLLSISASLSPLVLWNISKLHPTITFVRNY